MELQVKPHVQPKQFPVEVESADVTVKTLKETIHQLEGSYSVAKQRLFLGRQELEDGRTLASYRIEAGSQIVLHKSKSTKKNKVLRLMAKHIKCIAIGSSSVQDSQDSQEGSRALSHE